MKNLFRFISYVGHPLFVPFFTFLALKYACPVLFANVPHKTLIMWQMQIGLNTILFPALVVFLLWRLGFAENMYLRTTKERYVPIIASNFFYFWSFYVLHKQVASPPLLNLFLLCVFISSSLLLVATIFAKISMHATAWSVTLAFFVIFALKSPCASWQLVFATIAIFALVSMARLQLKEHTFAEIVTALIIGVISVIGCTIAYL